MKKYRIGMIGTNFVSDLFMEGLKSVQNATLTSVASLSLEDAQNFAMKYEIENSYDDYKQIKDIDIIYIATPNTLHKEMALHFLKRKIAVICEKPFALNYDEAKEMIDCAKKNNTFIMESLMPMYNPFMDIIKEYMSKIEPIREVAFTYSKYSSRYNAYLKGENPTTFRREFASGALMDLGVYTVGDALRLFGYPKALTARASFIETGVDVAINAILEYSGFNVSIRNSKVSNTQNWNEISGENGMIIFKDPNIFFEIYFIDKNGNKIELAKTTIHPMTHSIENALEALDKNLLETPLHNHKDILDLHKLMTDLRKDAGIKF